MLSAARILIFIFVSVATSGLLNATIRVLYAESNPPSSMTWGITVLGFLLGTYVAYKFKRNTQNTRNSLPDRPSARSTGKPLKVDIGKGFVVVDVETTGLNANRNKIIEIAAVKVLDPNSNNHACFSSLIKVKSKLPEKIIEITGITDEMLSADGEEIDDVMKFFANFAEDLPIVAYNAEFDKSFIDAAMANAGITLNNEYHCALKMVREAWPGLPNYKLVTVSTSLSFADEANHRALGDCKKALIAYIAALEVLGSPKTI